MNETTSFVWKFVQQKLNNENSKPLILKRVIDNYHRHNKYNIVSLPTFYGIDTDCLHFVDRYFRK